MLCEMIVIFLLTFGLPYVFNSQNNFCMTYVVNLWKTLKALKD